MKTKAKLQTKLPPTDSKGERWYENDRLNELARINGGRLFGEAAMLEMLESGELLDHWTVPDGFILGPGPYTKLCDLPDEYFNTGSRIDRLAKKAGYSSGRAWVNELGYWNKTRFEAEQFLQIATCED